MNKIRFVEVKDQVLTARTFSLVSLERPDSFNQKQVISCTYIYLYSTSALPACSTSLHHRTPVRGHFRGRS